MSDSQNMIWSLLKPVDDKPLALDTQHIVELTLKTEEEFFFCMQQEEEVEINTRNTGVGGECEGRERWGGGLKMSCQYFIDI